MIQIENAYPNKSKGKQIYTVEIVSLLGHNPILEKEVESFVFDYLAQHGWGVVSVEAKQISDELVKDAI